MSAASRQPLTGILNIDKPTGWTSHDVVAKVRRLLSQKSVGHAGTLDPLATGVLLVCVGQATRVAEYLMAGRKVYRATVQLGLETDTYDSDGATVTTAPVPELTHDDLTGVLARFTGAIAQTPPAYSAIKQDGVPSYRKARRGEAVTLAPRQVAIFAIDLLVWQPPYVTMDVTCDPGTYIRSLAHDLGQALHCGGTLTQLRRLQSGKFRVEDGVSLERLAMEAEAGLAADLLHPLSAALSGLIPVPVDAAASQRLLHGQPILCPTPPASDNPNKFGTPAGFALEPDGAVRAILTYDPAIAAWRPHKVFTADQ